MIALACTFATIAVAAVIFYLIGRYRPQWLDRFGKRHEGEKHE